MELSKTTLNFAAKRGLVLDICEVDEYVENDRLWIYTNPEDCEPDVSYVMNADGSFSYFDNLGLPDSIKEELPAFIKNEKHLREVLDFIATEMKALAE